MPREVGSLLEMATIFAEAIVAIPLELHEGLERVALKIEQTAKDEIGHYQPAVGPFPAWPELADATKDDRVSKGFTENDPLLRTGQRRDDITHQVEGLEAQIGTPENAATADIAVWEEFGTSKEPMRPVLGPAAFRSRSVIEKLVGAALVAGLIGKDQVHQALGYDFQTTD
jgi:hypothetical protein